MVKTALKAMGLLLGIIILINVIIFLFNIGQVLIAVVFAAFFVASVVVYIASKVEVYLEGK